MTPTKAQREWCAQYLPAAKAKVIDLIPRAYCIAKPAIGYAVMVTPQADYREHLVISHDGNDPFYSAVGVRNPIGGITAAVPMMEIRIGQWFTLVFIGRDGGGTDWVALPLLPLTRSKSKSVKTGTTRRGR